MSRWFLAYRLNGLAEDPGVKRLMAKMKRTADQREIQARWARPELWHLTMLFLGEVTDPAGIIARLADLRPPPGPVSARVQGVGAFPDPSCARVIWFGVARDQHLLSLRERLATEFGEPVGESDFRPHVTLGRFRNPTNVQDLVGLGGRGFFGEYALGELILFESVIQGHMAKHVPHFRKVLD